MKFSSQLCFATAVLLASGAVHAAFDFKRGILPLLESHCFKCHRAPHKENGRMVNPKGDLRLDATWALLRGNGEVIPVEPKDVAHSGIVAVVTLLRDDDMAIPPEGKGGPPTVAKIFKLKTWITEGAEFGGCEGNVEGKPAKAAKSSRTKSPSRISTPRRAARGLPLDQIIFSPSMRIFTACDKGQPITSIFG